MKLTSTIGNCTIEFILERILEKLSSFRRIPLKRVLSAIVLALSMAWSISAHAQISYVNSWNSSTRGTEGLAINTGTGTLAGSGDLLLAAITIYNAATISPPNGWSTAVQQWTNGPMNSVVFYKIAAASDVGATFTFTTGGADAYLSGGVIALSGVNQLTPIDSAGTGSDGGSGAVTARSITTSVANDWLIWFGTSEEASGSVSVPTGYSTAWDFPGSWSTEGSTLGYSGPVSAGPTGNVAGGGASVAWQAVLVGVEPGTQTAQTAPPASGGSCSTLTTLSSSSPLQISSSDITQFPFLGSPYIGWCLPLDPITSSAGINCLDSNLNTPTKTIFPLMVSTGWCLTQNNAQQGYYWGRVIGADGMFFQGAPLDQPVGYDTSSKPYQLAKQFQQYYAPWGASNNFYFINFESGPLHFDGSEWYSSTWPNQMIENVREAAALAAYAGFVGMAFNTERHDAFWDVDPNLPNKGQIIEQWGYNIGQAIKSEMPGASVMILEGCPTFQDPATIPTSQRNLNGYYYFPEFCYGLVQAKFAQFADGGDDTWLVDAAGDNPIPHDVKQFQFYTWPQLEALGIPVDQVTDAPGFWPLGHPYKDPSTGRDVLLPDGLLEYSNTATVNSTPTTWQDFVDSAYALSLPYTYIFQLGSAYEITPNDPFGTGPLDPNFAQYINEFHMIKQKYAQ